MLKRKIEQKLIDWKNTENRKPLIIKGCRQCGKTFSVLDFAKKNYKNVVYLNFFELCLCICRVPGSGHNRDDAVRPAGQRGGV